MILIRGDEANQTKRNEIRKKNPLPQFPSLLRRGGPKGSGWLKTKTQLTNHKQTIMKHHIYLLLWLSLMLSLPLLGQLTNNVQLPTSINTTGNAPDASAILDVQSTSKGMLVPRMTAAQRNAISNPATGLLIFDTSTGDFCFYDGSAWQNLSTNDGYWLQGFGGGIYHDDPVSIGSPLNPLNYNLYVHQSDFGAGSAGIVAYRASTNTASDEGTAWTNGGVTAAVEGISSYGNNYSAAVYGSSGLNYSNSAAVLGTNLEADVFGALAFRDDSSDLWAGYFDGQVRIKQQQSGRAISFENHNDNNNWTLGISAVTDNLYFFYNDVLMSSIRDSDGVYVVNSDRSLKTDIEYLGSVLPKITQLKPAKYYYKSATDAPQKSHGFIAQEVQQIFPELVHEHEDGKLALAYDDFAILSIQAIKEQQAIIEAQNTKIANQDAKIESQAQKNDDLKAEVESQNQKIGNLEQRLAKLEALLTNSTK